MAKLAYRADLEYNEVSNNVVLGSACDTPSRTHLDWRYVMDTIPQDNTPRKQCSACKGFFPATPEYFYRRSNRPSGLSSQCKGCKNQWFKEYNRTHYEQRKAQSLKYRQENHEKYKQSQAAYRQSHPEQRHAAQKTWAQKHVQERNSYHKRPDMYAKKLVYNQNRRARRLVVPGSHTPEQSKAQYDRQKGKCYWCKQKIAWGKHHEDHIISLTREGSSNDISNIVITCAPCNIRKQAKMPHEWHEGGRLL